MSRSPGSTKRTLSIHINGRFYVDFCLRARENLPPLSQVQSFPRAGERMTAFGMTSRSSSDRLRSNPAVRVGVAVTAAIGRNRPYPTEVPADRQSGVVRHPTGQNLRAEVLCHPSLIPRSNLEPPAPATTSLPAARCSPSPRKPSPRASLATAAANLHF